MKPNPVTPDVLAVVALLMRNGKFRVQLTPAEATLALELYKKSGTFPYNGMPANMPEIIHAISTASGKVNFPDINGKPNPNTGSQCHMNISIGNEGSLVIYVQIVTTYPVTKPYGELLTDLQSVGERFSAQENTVDTRPGSFTVRLWWD